MSATDATSFGPFTLDVRGAELRRGSERIRLRPKCFDLLAYLVSNRGRLVSKDELLDKVWAGVIVNESTVNRTVTTLRAALGDDAGNPQYIETLSRRGYKFIASVSRVANEPTPDLALVHDGQEHPLQEGEQIIGRGQDATIPLYAIAASRHHARITVSENTVTVEDLGSRNGTYVNGSRIAGSVEIKPGDEIRIGADRLVLWSRSGETESLR